MRPRPATFIYRQPVESPAAAWEKVLAGMARRWFHPREVDDDDDDEEVSRQLAPLVFLLLWMCGKGYHRAPHLDKWQVPLADLFVSVVEGRWRPVKL